MARMYNNNSYLAFLIYYKSQAVTLDHLRLPFITVSLKSALWDLDAEIRRFDAAYSFRSCQNERVRLRTSGIWNSIGQKGMDRQTL